MSEHKPFITFTPVPVRPRHDGWSPERQIAFIEKLADCGSVIAAAKHVGMNRESARRLRRRPCGRAFRDAWDAALDCGYAEVEEGAMERSKNGVVRPIFYQGEQVGEWRHHDERLTMFLLRFRRRHRFGPEADSLPRPPQDIPGFDPDEQLPFDPEGMLEGTIVGIDVGPDDIGDFEGYGWSDGEGPEE